MTGYLSIGRNSENIRQQHAGRTVSRALLSIYLSIYLYLAI